MPCLDFDIIKKLVNCLLLFENSCEEIYLEKFFVKLAVAGRHGKIDCFLSTHNLFHQSKWSRTIDLNATYIVFCQLIPQRAKG